MDKIGTAVIGAGVVGLAVACELSRRGSDVVVFERNDSFGQDASSRSSEVIHGGMYYAPGSLRAVTAVEGKEMLYRICADAGIPHRRIGKLIVAQDDGERESIEGLAEQGWNNGVDDLRFLSQSELTRYAPELSARHALLSPSTGIIDSHALMKYLEARTKEKDGLLCYGCETLEIRKGQSDYLLKIKEPDGGITEIAAEAVVNCAGLFADRLAETAGIDIDREGYRINFFKGEFVRVNRPERVPRDKLVYPVLPMDKIGVHTVVDLQGQVKLGPLGSHIEKRIDYRMAHDSVDEFFDPISGFLPRLSRDDLSLDTCGIVPKLDAPGEPTSDYIIRHEADRGLPGLVNLVGIQSPGLTSCLSIARMVSGLLG